MSVYQGQFVGASPNAGPGMAQDAGVWRLGTGLTMRHGAELPPFCIWCGQPAGNRPIRRRLAWHEPYLYLLLLGGIILYFIIAQFASRFGFVNFPICARHRASRTIRRVASYLGVSLGIALFIVGIAEIIWPLAIGGWAMLLAGLLGIIFGGKLPSAKKIDDFFITIKGVDESFLVKLPQIPLPMAPQQPAPGMFGGAAGQPYYPPPGGQYAPPGGQYGPIPGGQYPGGQYPTGPYAAPPAGPYGPPAQAPAPPGPKPPDAPLYSPPWARKNPPPPPPLPPRQGPQRKG